MGGSLTGLMGAGAGLGASGLARLGGCLLPGWAPIPAKSPTPPPDGASWNHRLMLGDAPRLVDSAPWDAALLPAWLCRCWGVEAQRQCAGQSMGVGSPGGRGDWHTVSAESYRCGQLSCCKRYGCAIAIVFANNSYADGD